MNLRDPRSYLIVALDVPSAKDALNLVDQLNSSAGFFKIGLQLFTSQGPQIVRQVKESGCGVFLDLKLHDIPHTVANAVLEATSHGIDMMTIHTMGGEKMMIRAKEVLEDVKKTGQPVPQLLGVTVLTSMDSEELEKIGFKYSIKDLVVRLAQSAQRAGLDGLVCSPKELTRLQDEGIQDLFFVTPGIRPSSISADDQKRITTPLDAISMGARHLVVGRPVIKAENPKAAAKRILDEIEKGLENRDSKV